MDQVVPQPFQQHRLLDYKSTFVKLLHFIIVLAPLAFLQVVSNSPLDKRLTVAIPLAVSSIFVPAILGPLLAYDPKFHLYEFAIFCWSIPAFKVGWSKSQVLGSVWSYYNDFILVFQDLLSCPTYIVILSIVPLTLIILTIEWTYHYIVSIYNKKLGLYGQYHMWLWNLVNDVHLFLWRMLKPVGDIVVEGAKELEKVYLDFARFLCGLGGDGSVDIQDAGQQTLPVNPPQASLLPPYSVSSNSMIHSFC